MRELVRCHLCQRPLPDQEPDANGLAFCAIDTAGCYFLARRRLGIPKSVCVEWWEGEWEGT